MPSPPIFTAATLILHAYNTVAFYTTDRGGRGGGRGGAQAGHGAAAAAAPRHGGVNVWQRYAVYKAY